jgi:hypothetical protein
VFQTCKRLNLRKLFLGIQVRFVHVGRIAMKVQPAIRTLVLILITAAMISSARAESLVLASVGTAANPNQTNSRGSTITVVKNGDWDPPLAGSSWVSFGPTGDASNPKFTAVPIGTVVSFFDEFDIAGSATGGTLRFMTDDSASVYLNGSLIYAEASQTSEDRAACSDTENGCLAGVTIKLPKNLLRHGPNKLEFRLAQRRGVSFGLDYRGKVDLIDAYYPVFADRIPPSAIFPITVPEPSSLSMLIAGIVALAAMALLSTKKTAV